MLLPCITILEQYVGNNSSMHTFRCIQLLKNGTNLNMVLLNNLSHVKQIKFKHT